jgi:hypothetical protein
MAAGRDRSGLGRLPRARDDFTYEYDHGHSLVAGEGTEHTHKIRQSK